MERRAFWRRYPRIISKQNPLHKIIQLSLTGARAEKAFGPWGNVYLGGYDNDVHVYSNPGDRERRSTPRTAAPKIR